MTTTTTTILRTSRIQCFLLTCCLLVLNNKAFVQQQTAPIRVPPTTLVRLFSTAAATATKPDAKRRRGEPNNNDDDDDPNRHLLQMGRAIDILNQDYGELLTTRPDFSIYDANVQCIAPKGAVLCSGLGNYKAVIGILQAMVPLAYSDTTMQHKVVDANRLSALASATASNNTIRIHWHMQGTPRFSTGLSSQSNQHTLDGISVYRLSPLTGNITEHRIERLLWQPPAATTQLWQQLFARRQTAKAAGVAVPHCAKEASTTSNQVVQFQQFNPFDTRTRSSRLFSGSTEGAEPMFDAAALESRNKSRKKFGLKPLSPQEFMELQQQILSQEQAQKNLAATQVPRKEQQPSPRKGNFMDKLRGALGGSDKLDTCESNFDCERPLVCCDFGLVRRCCSTGAMVGPQQPRLVPVPADSGYEKRPRQIPRSY